MKKYAVLAGIMALCLLTGCRKEKQSSVVVKSVKADTVVVYGESARVTFPGKVIAASDINLAFRVSGPILRMHVDVGSYVRKGQVLAEIDPRDYETQLAATRAEYQQVKGEAERIIGLYEKQSVAPNDYEKALYGLQQITAKLDAHTHALADTRLTAPCDGFVQKRLFEAGETVSAGLPVVSMISSGTPEVEINIPSADYIRRDRFDTYSCTVDIYPGRSFPLELIGITRKANMNQLYTMRFRLAGNEMELPGPGMSTLVTIQYKPENSGTVSVPVTAVFESGTGSSAVWVYDPVRECVNRREVKVSQILSAGTAIISSGLQPDELVISAGVHTLQEGERVRLLPPVSATNVGGML
ncbi:MAG: efflux RND transporter periplasmic adaptor subunit [Tannerellaceae bacterium]|nr:efflux RND transporter periplasmic adaptor subunit [Tannerellaceae bacterium]